MKILQEFVLNSSVEFALAQGMTAKSALPPKQRWLSMSGNGNRPEIYLTGTDLNAARYMVFAYGDKKKLADAAADDVWIADLAGQLDVETPIQAVSYDINDGYIVDTDGKEKAVTSKYFRPSKALESSELLVKATMTSSSIPGVFEPQKWDLLRRRPGDFGKTQGVAKHSFVDGGLIDNSPVDLAVHADATHIISIELTPLYSYNDGFDNDKEYNLVSILGSSFNACFTGSLQRSLSYIGEANESRIGADKRNIYRIAPLVPAAVLVPADDGELEEVEVSPGTVSFSGVYNKEHKLVMGLYDWFMQGYVDAMGWAEPNKIEDFVSDPVVADYLTNGQARGNTFSLVLGGNMFWYMTERPIPEAKDFQAAQIGIPDPEDLATRTK